jgi:hypothetical protein
MALSRFESRLADLFARAGSVFCERKVWPILLLGRKLPVLPDSELHLYCFRDIDKRAALIQELAAAMDLLKDPNSPYTRLRPDA